MRCYGQNNETCLLSLWSGHTLAKEVERQAADLRSFLPKTGSGLLNTQPPLDALSGSSAAHVTVMCSVKPLTMNASTTR